MDKSNTQNKANAIHETNEINKITKPKFRLLFLAPKYWLLWIGFALLRLSVFLPYKLLMQLGTVLGIALIPFAPARRKIIARNLELCFPDKSAAERTKLLRANFASVGMAIFETAIAWWWSDAKIKQLCKDFEIPEQLKRSSQGILFVIPHLTTLEITGKFLLLNFQKATHNTYRAHKNLVFDYMQLKHRQKHIKSYLIEHDNVMLLIKTLKKGKAVWYAPDQDHGLKRSVFVPFFGIPAATVTATGRIANITAANVVMMESKRLDNYQGYKVKIHAPLLNFPTNNLEQDCRTINQQLEQIILKSPEQYLWAHRRFKTRPVGESSLYDD